MNWIRTFRWIDERPGSTVRRFTLSGAFWMLLATTVGLTAATELVSPELVKTRYLLFPRIRPVHVNTNVFGFLSMLLVGPALFAVCRLSKTELYSEKLGNWTMWIWNAAVVTGALTIVCGYTQSHEYAEYVWPVDVLILAGLLMLGYNVARTLRRRSEQLLYVTNWYVVGALAATLVVYVLGNVMWRPMTGALTGMTDAEWAWFYAHNIFGTWITPLGLGLCYFWIPREADQPLYSHTLSLIGFWPYFAFYLQVGTHHLIEAPAPAWLKLIAEVNSAGLLIPVFAFLANQWMTLRGKWWRIPDSIVLRFIFAGTVFYFFTSVEGTLLAMPSFERITHFTNYVVGHSHLGLLGFSGFIACGAGYGVLREMYGEIWSERLASLQYWLMLIGIVGFTIVLDDAGSIQGHGWRNGEVVYRVLPELMNDYVLRAILGCFIVTGAALQLYNYVRTVQAQRFAPPLVGAAPGPSRWSAAPPSAAEVTGTGPRPALEEV